MATGDEKRTHKLTKTAVDMLEVLKTEGKLDKSDNVDRAIKLYYRLLREGKLPDDPYVDQDRIERLDDMLEDRDERGSSWRDKLF